MKKIDTEQLFSWLTVLSLRMFIVLYFIAFGWVEWLYKHATFTYPEWRRKMALFKTVEVDRSTFDKLPVVEKFRFTDFIKRSQHRWYYPKKIKLRMKALEEYTNKILFGWLD